MTYILTHSHVMQVDRPCIRVSLWYPVTRCKVLSGSNFIPYIYTNFFLTGLPWESINLSRINYWWIYD